MERAVERRDEGIAHGGVFPSRPTAVSAAVRGFCLFLRNWPLCVCITDGDFRALDRVFSGGLDEMAKGGRVGYAQCAVLLLFTTPHCRSIACDFCIFLSRLSRQAGWLAGCVSE